MIMATRTIKGMIGTAYIVIKLLVHESALKIKKSIKNFLIKILT